MATRKYPDQVKQAKLHSETGRPEEGVSWSPYRNPPYQYDEVVAADKETDESDDAPTTKDAKPHG